MASNWKVIRLQALQQDGYTCQRCGKKISNDCILEVHYKIPKHSGSFFFYVL